MSAPSLKINAESSSETLCQLAEEMSGESVRKMTGGGSGANSRIIKVHGVKKNFALKFYREGKINLCDRLDAETKALHFFRKHGITSIPQVVAANHTHNCSLLEWIDGVPVKNGGSLEIAATCAFLEKIHQLKNVEGAESLPYGTEACLSAAELLRQVKERLVKLETGTVQHARFKQLIEFHFAPIAETVGQWCESAYNESGMSFGQEISHELETISPVDVGFHNILRKENGDLIFVDFEYCGWDDPVKLVADTLQHPGMCLDLPKQELFFKKTTLFLKQDTHYLKRLKILYPLYGLRWCAIMLNEFLPGYRRIATKENAGTTEDLLKEGKLKRVDLRLQQILETHRTFPFPD